MKNSKTITPTVNIDGKSIPIEGWMFVFSFALAGVEWAVKQASDPTYDLRGKILASQDKKHKEWLLSQIDILEKKLLEYKTELGVKP